jgi:hypothetical protein
MRAQPQFVLATVSSHAREVLVHHIEIDDDRGCFEF